MTSEGKVALVTGAGRGIGAAVAARLAAHGLQVAAHYHRTVPAVIDADAPGVDRARAGNPRPADAAKSPAMVAFQKDLSKPGACAELIAAVMARFGRIDYLVNNAALTPPAVPGAETHPPSFERATAAEPFDAALWDQTLAINLRVPAELTLAAAAACPGFAAAVNLGAAPTSRGDGSSIYFTASKGAVPALTQYLARRLAPQTRVNAVLPGLVTTEEIAARGAGFEPLRQEIIRRTPMGRLGEPDEIAEVVEYCLYGCNFLTGAVISVDGGLTL